MLQPPSPAITAKNHLITGSAGNCQCVSRYQPFQPEYYYQAGSAIVWLKPDAQLTASDFYQALLRGPTGNVAGNDSGNKSGRQLAPLAAAP